MTKTTPSDASRIQSTQALAGHDHGRGSFPARMQSAAAHNVNAGITPGRSGGGSSGASRIAGGGGGGGGGKSSGGSGGRK